MDPASSRQAVEEVEEEEHLSPESYHSQRSRSEAAWTDVQERPLLCLPGSQLWSPPQDLRSPWRVPSGSRDARRGGEADCPPRRPWR